MTTQDVAAVVLLGVTVVTVLGALAVWLATGRRPPPWTRW